MAQARSLPRRSVWSVHFVGRGGDAAVGYTVEGQIRTKALPLELSTTLLRGAISLW